MSNSLEKIVQSEPVTLKQELAESIRQYPQTLKKYVKMLAPAMAISAVGSALGQWGCESLGYTSDFAVTAAAYVFGYTPGYSWFFVQEYLTNKEKYPNGMWSKDFAEFIGTFLAADYVADLLTFTPTFIASNLWLKNHTKMHSALRSMSAWTLGGVFYTITIAALHPVTRRMNQTVNAKIKSACNAILSLLYTPKAG